MSIVKTIIEKMKIKEIFAIAFISGLIITFMPDAVAYKLQIMDLRNAFQQYISIGLIVIG